MRTFFYKIGQQLLITSSICLLLCSCATTIQYKAGTPEAVNGITSLENIKINGLKHAVLIRGKNLNNPIIVYIHSMGIPTMCFAYDEYGGDNIKESKFTVVHYDQRGFGKTYRHGKHHKKQLTIEQYTSDAEELVKYIKDRFNKQKIYLMGESWGSVIGAKLAAKHPDWFYAYIAVPQIGDVEQSLSDAYDFAIQNAVSDSNINAINDLKRFGKPNSSLSKRNLNRAIAFTGKWMDYYNMKRYKGQDMTGYFFACLWNAPEYSLFDFTGTLNGFQKTSPRINVELINFNLINEVPEMDLPFYVIIGEYDLYLNRTKEYFDRVKAGKKYWVPLKNAGHMVRGEQYQAFDSVLYYKILPDTYK